jgi:hypothetical protein
MPAGTRKGRRFGHTGTPLPSAQPLQHRRRGKPVGHLYDRGLELAQRIAGPAAEPAIGLAHVVAALRQQLLQLVAFSAREHTLWRGQACANGSPPRRRSAR